MVGFNIRELPRLWTADRLISRLGEGELGSSDVGGGYHSLSNVPTSRQRLGIVARAGCDCVEVQTHGVKGLVVLVGAGDDVERVCRAGVFGEAGEGEGCYTTHAHTHDKSVQ